MHASVWMCMHMCFYVYLSTWLPRATAAAVCDNAPCLIYGCLAPGSTISDCVPRCVPVSHTHTHTHKLSHREGPAAGDRLLLSVYCQPVQHTALYPTLIFIDFPPLPPNLDMHSLKNRPTAEFGPWEGRISPYLGGESKVLTVLHLAILILVQISSVAWAITAAE